MSKKNFYVVMAMKRSGHHVFVRWLCENNGNITHRNDPIEKLSEGDFDGRQKKQYGEGRDTLVNFEDFDTDDLPIIKYPNNSRVYKILFMRDFGNWLASCFKRKSHPAHQYRDVYDNLFSSHINIRGKLKTNRLDLYERQMKLWLKRERDIILVSYNKFIASSEYRDVIAEKLNLENNFGEDVLDEVTPFGDGSSFTGTERKTISLNQVYSRFMDFIHHPDYQSLLITYNELLQFSDEEIW